MSSDLDVVFLSILNNQVPIMWADKAYPSLKPLGSWLKDLRMRIDFMNEWAKVCTPATFWMSGMFYPQGFMTGILQTYSRKEHISIDRLDFGFKVCDFEKNTGVPPPVDGVYINGLYIEGAVWEAKKRCLTDQMPGEMFDKMPLIHFIPVEDYKRRPSEYSCPLYKTSARAGLLSTTGQSTNYILEVDLPCERGPEHWILRGAALLCQLDD
jgi:dynein heavy chain